MPSVTRSLIHAAYVVLRISIMSGFLFLELARCMSEQRLLIIQPSRFQWHKAKDWFHFYFLVGIIPVVTTVFFVNVFIGPATLTEIPEDYVPKEWEYHQVRH